MQVRHITLGFVLALFASTVHAQDFPKRKAGLWAIKTIDAADKANAMQAQMCIDASIDADLQKRDGKFQKEMGFACGKDVTRREAGKFIHESLCTQGKQKMKTRTVMSGDFQKSYRAESTTTFDPPFNGAKDSRTVHEGTWLGPCKAGQKAGDVTVPGRGSVNIVEMQKLMDAVQSGKMTQEEANRRAQQMRKSQ